MDDHRDAVLALFLILVVFPAIVALALILVHVKGSEENHTKTEAVCTYLGGKMHGDVCIVNGKVVSTKPVNR